MTRSTKLSRRSALGRLSFPAGLALLSGCQQRRPSSARQARIVIIGGGFAGATVARTLKQLDPAVRVTLVEPKRRYVACPFSNLVLAGLRSISQQTFRYDALRAADIRVIHQLATAIDYDAATVTLADNTALPFDRLVVTPGIEIAPDALPGYNENAMTLAPHAWQAGEQTLLLRRQLEAMPDGGLVAMAIPDNPYRCPPGPYERASLIAWYLQQHKPRSKLLLLDAKDHFSKQPLFEARWQQQYGGLLEWQGRSDGAAVIEVQAQAHTLVTDFDLIQADVLNVIPPQYAGRLAQRADLTDASGWCPVEAATFESTRHAGVYVLGDAAIANAMPKSAFAANAQGRLCAAQLLANLQDRPPLDAKLLNTCYSLLQPGQAISVAGVYRPAGERWQAVEGAGGASPLEASLQQRKREADYAEAWYEHLTDALFRA